MKRKFLSMLLILSMAAAFIPFAGSAKVRADVTGFPDVTSETVNSTAYKAIYWAAGEGIIRGFSDGTFRPEDSCTREQFVVMIWRLNGKPQAESEVSFTDVDSSRSTYKAMQWAVEQGIIKGFSDGSFRPEDKVTREQVAIMLWRMAGKPEIIPGEEGAETGISFSDFSEEKSTWPAVAWGVSAGLIKGFSDGTFGPEQDCQRQQIAIFLYRYVKNVLGKDPAEASEKVDVWLLKSVNDIYNSAQIEYEYDAKGRIVKVSNKSNSESLLVTYDETAKSVKIDGDGSWRGCDSAVIDFYDDGTVKKIMGYKGSVQVLEEQFMEDGRPEYNKEWYDDGELLNWSKYEYSGGVPATVETEKYLDKDGNVTGGHTLTPVYDSQKRLTEEREFDLDENLLGTTRYIYPDATSTDWNVREYYNPGDTDPWEKESIVTTGDTEILTTLSWNGTAYDETFRSETVYDSNDEVRSYTEYYFKSTKPSYMEMTTYNDKDGTKTVTVVGDLGTTIRIEYYEKVQLDEYPLLDLYAGDFFSY